MRFTPALILLSMASMCGKDGDDSATDDSSTPTISPEQGHWTATEATLVSDGCGIYEPPDSGDTGTDTSGFTLVMVTETSFTVTMDEDEDGETRMTTCALTGSDFTCEGFLLLETDYAGQGYEAVVSLTQAITGTFVDEMNLDATSVLEATCAGAECAEVSAASGIPFPCEVTLTNTASHDL